MEKIKLSEVFSINADELFNAWMNSKKHSDFTGGKAIIQSKVGGKFTAWDGYISGKTLELRPYSKIIQAWRTTEFPNYAPDSKLEILFDELKTGTRLTLIHSNIPEGQGKNYEKGWIEFYFEPMKLYFSKK